MVPLYKPFMTNNLPELGTILHSGNLAYGKYGKEFEEKLRSFIGVNNLLTVNSFNSSVLVTLITLGIKPGDEIIASPMACLASNQPFVTIGADVVWADVDPRTGTLCPDSVKQKITSKTKAIFHNHFCGYPGHINDINSIGLKYGIPVVNDAIEAFGSEYKGIMIGSIDTDITIFSFQAVRLPTTIDGGAIVFKDNYLYNKSIRVRDSGIDRKYFRDNLGEINPNYDISIPGFGATMSEVNSYIGGQQMEVIKELIDKQRNNALKWTEIINNNYPAISMLNNNMDSNPNFWIFGILAKNKNETIKNFREKGYYASSVHLPNNYYSVFGERIILPGVEEFYSKFVALPSGWWVNI